MANFVDKSYDKLVERAARIESFFADLESRLSAINAPQTNHLEIYWDTGKVRRISDDIQIQSLSLADRLKYYHQGIGLMKLAINRQLLPN
jgi:hypothetical protein